jgi:hypothetical protein
VLVHFRLTTPAALTDQVVQLLLSRDWVTNVTLDRGASLLPEGDLVECDVRRPAPWSTSFAAWSSTGSVGSC